MSLLITIYFLIHLKVSPNWLRGQKYLAYFVVSSLIIVSYFLGYEQTRFLGAEKFNVLAFLKYIFFEINGAIGNYNKHLFGYALIPAVAIVVFVKLLLSSVKTKKVTGYYPILSLMLFSFLFSSATAFGRIGVGMEGAYTSRYATLIIPLYFGLYLYFVKFLNETIKKLILTFLIVFFVFVLSQNNHFNYTYGSQRKTALQNWEECYRYRENVEQCQISAGIQIYHSPDLISLESKLQFLKKHKLSFFSQ